MLSNEQSLIKYTQKFLVAVTKYPSSRGFYLEMLAASAEKLKKIQPKDTSADKIMKSLKNIVDLFIVKGFRSML